MKKGKKIEVDLTDSLNTNSNSLQQETDEIILDQINKRKEENQALKKLLENLNSSLFTNK